MISITKNLRSAAIVAIAIGALAATGAMAQNLSTPGASHSPHSKSSPAPKATPSSKPSESPDATGSPSDAQTEKPDAAGGKHGDCVSKVARDHGLVADNGHGQTNHGAAVSKAAHDCPQ